MPKTSVCVSTHGAFWVVLSFVLLWWSYQVPVGIPALHFPVAGVLCLGLGATFWIGGVLGRCGTGGALAKAASLVPQPIYLGFGLGWAGWALFAGSAQGFWLGTAMIGLVGLTLVWGRDLPDLGDGAGRETAARPWFGLPKPVAGRPSFREGFGAMAAGGLPWLLAYNGVKMMGAYPDAIETRMPWEWNIPIQGWTSLIYASPYYLVPVAFLLQKERLNLRRFLIRSWLCTAVATLFYLTIPLSAEFRPPEVGFMAESVVHEQMLSWPAVASWPSFHVIWAFLVAQALAGLVPGWLRYVWASAVAVTCLTTGMHSVADVLAGFALWLVLRKPEKLWQHITAVTERAAAQGPVLWVGLAGTIGLLVVLAAAGDAFLWPAFGVFACGLAGTRALGFYGSALGGLLGLTLVGWAGLDWHILAGALAVAVPWIRLFGRMPRLTTGSSPVLLVSQLANVAIGMVLARLWSLGAGELQVAGFGMILSGAMGFVEEGCRGSSSAPRIAGLGRSQWPAVALVMLGMGLCLFHSRTAPGFEIPVLSAWAWCLGCGFVSAVVMVLGRPGSR